MRAAFIDRDGLINHLVVDPVTGHPESPLRVQDVRLIFGSVEALQQLRSAGWLLVGVSNQPAAAKGSISVTELESIQAHVLELLASAGVRFDAFKLCLHHPDAVVPELRGPCSCRKPAPGMLLAAARELEIELNESCMIGDTDQDVLAGRAAGCKTVLVEHPDSQHKRAGESRPDATVPNLLAAASLLCSQHVVD